MKDFLFKVLEKFGFGERWIEWIRRYFNDIRISVLVNGVPNKEFTPEKGLRKGDPLSPLLFNIAAEVLNCILIKANCRDLFQGITRPTGVCKQLEAIRRNFFKGHGMEGEVNSSRRLKLIS